MSYEIVGAKETVNALIEMHRRTIARIESGEKFYKRGHNVTREVFEASKFEVAQCLAALPALDNMSAGNIQRASNLLSQIKEFIPND